MTEALKNVDGARAAAAQGPAPGDKTSAHVPLTFTVNGESRTISVHPHTTLLDTLRMEMGLTGTKGACTEGECGSCTVILAGKPVCSCLVMTPQVQGRDVTTIEGLGHNGKLHILQQKFIEAGAVQCGYCTPGLIMAAKDILDNMTDCSEAQFVTAMEGNICRCTGYTKIFDAIRGAHREFASTGGSHS